MQKHLDMFFVYHRYKYWGNAVGFDKNAPFSIKYKKRLKGGVRNEVGR
jgi:hypothetical protein